MEPFTLALGALGLGAQLFGGLSAAGDASDIAKQQQYTATQSLGINTNISNLESQVNEQHRIQMESSGRRLQLENFRNTQRASAMGLNNAVSQNAQFGTGSQGAQYQIASQGMFQGQGIDQNLEIGRNIFGLDSQISQQKLALSQLQTQSNVAIGGFQSSMATAQGYSSLGGAVTKSAGMLGQMSQGFGKINVPGYNPFAGMLAG